MIEIKRRKQFFINGAILTLTSFLLQTIGVGMNIFVSNKIGSEGMGLFQLVMSVYRLCVTLATSGILIASTRLIATEFANNNVCGAKKVAKTSVMYSLFFGLLTLALVMTFAEFIGTVLLGDKRTVKALRLLALSMPFISMSSALSGYFTAVRRVYKTASAQVFEQLIRATAVIYLTVIFCARGTESACMAIVGGGTIAELSSFCYLYILYLVDKRRYKVKDNCIRHCLPDILKISVPVAISSYLRSTLSTIEHIMVPKGLEHSGMLHHKALSSYGLVHGMVIPVIMFPSAVLYSFSSLLVPEITEFAEKKDRLRISHTVETVIFTTLIFAVGTAGILCSFSSEIGIMVYNNRDTCLYIFMLAPLICAMYLDGAVDAMLKGLNQQVAVMRYNIAESAVSIVLIIYLLPRYGILGYIIVIYAGELVNTLLSLNRLIKVTDFKLDIVRFFITPLLCILFSSYAVRAVSALSFASFSTILKLFFTAAIYLLMTAIFRFRGKQGSGRFRKYQNKSVRF